MRITALYAALLTPILLFLTFRVIGQRRSQKVEIGDGNDRELLRRMRVHANFVETVPMGLILLGLAESLKAPSIALHVLGLALLVGRVVHAYGLSQTPHILPMRFAGMVMTITALFGGAALCLALFVLTTSVGP
jgi:uncharacterized protein